MGVCMKAATAPLFRPSSVAWTPMDRDSSSTMPNGECLGSTTSPRRRAHVHRHGMDAVLVKSQLNSQCTALGGYPSSPNILAKRWKTRKRGGNGQGKKYYTAGTVSSSATEQSRRSISTNLTRRVEKTEDNWKRKRA